MWELYAVWAWAGAFVASERGLPSWTGPAYAFAVIAAGGPGCVVAGIASDRWGRAQVTIAAMATSAVCCLLVGPTALPSAWLAPVVGLVWGFSVVADSAQFSTLVTEHAPLPLRRLDATPA